MRKNEEKLQEDLTKNDVRSEIKNEMSTSSFEKKIKQICAEVLSDMYKAMWQKKSFWTNDVTR